MNITIIIFNIFLVFGLIVFIMKFGEELGTFFSIIFKIIGAILTFCIVLGGGLLAAYFILTIIGNILGYVPDVIGLDDVIIETHDTCFLGSYEIDCNDNRTNLTKIRTYGNFDTKSIFKWDENWIDVLEIKNE